MRLIDAEKLVESLQKWDTPKSKNFYNFAMEHIIRQAIYDTDKVVAELEKELKRADEEKLRCVKENPLQFDSAKGYAKGYANGIAVAIQIVKGGGVDGC